MEDKFFVDGIYILRHSKRIADADLLPINVDAMGVAVVKHSDISVPINDSPEKQNNIDNEREGIYSFNIIKKDRH